MYNCVKKTPRDHIFNKRYQVGYFNFFGLPSKDKFLHVFFQVYGLGSLKKKP